MSSADLVQRKGLGSAFRASGGASNCSTNLAIARSLMLCTRTARRAWQNAPALPPIVGNSPFERPSRFPPTSLHNSLGRARRRAVFWGYPPLSPRWSRNIVVHPAGSPLRSLHPARNVDAKEVRDQSSNLNIADTSPLHHLETGFDGDFQKVEPVRMKSRKARSGAGTSLRPG